MRSLALGLQRVLAFSDVVSSPGWLPSFGGAQETKRLVLKDSCSRCFWPGTYSAHVAVKTMPLLPVTRSCSPEFPVLCRWDWGLWRSSAHPGDHCVVLPMVSRGEGGQLFA